MHNVDDGYGYYGLSDHFPDTAPAVHPLVFQIPWHHRRNKQPHNTLEALIPLRISDSLHQHNGPVPKIYGG